MSDNEIDFNDIQDKQQLDDDDGASMSVISTSSLHGSSSSQGGPSQRGKRKAMGATRGRRKVSLRRRGLAGNNTICACKFSF
jgi:hypothetical protein